MNVFQAELKYFLRSPLIWLVLAVSAFISAWSFLLTLDLFTSLQVKFATMSDAPNITQGIVFPLLTAQSKILMLVIAIVGGLSFARLADANGWSLLISAQCSDMKIIMHKYLALLVVMFIFVVPLLLAIISLVLLSDIELWPVLLAMAGLFLLLMWMGAISMLLSSFVNNSGFAILLNLVFFMLLWLFSQSANDGSYGKNWIEVLSPYYHFVQFQSSYISLASLLYFVAGTVFILGFVRIRLVHKRYSL